MLEKLNRLREMSGNEMAHRLREKVRQEADRARFHSGIGLNDDPGVDALINRHSLSIKTYLRQGPARRFYSSTQEREKTAQFVIEHFPEWLDRAIREGMRLSEHRLNILGHEDVGLGQDIN